LEGYKYSLSVKSKRTMEKTQEVSVLETTWKQARNETFKVHEMEQLHLLTNNKITKVICFKCYSHKTMTCLTKLEGFMCT